MTSNSPSKKNSWKEQSVGDSNKNNVSIDSSSTNNNKKLIPKIPINKKGLTQSSASERGYPTTTANSTNLGNLNNNSINNISQDESFMSDTKSYRSMVNMDELKKIRVYHIEKPAEKKYRKV